MTLPFPNLDDRRFADLVDEARARIPRFTPEWTNFNDSDPGFTLVKLHAWLTETLLYRVNQVPDLVYLKFLDLLGVIPIPARAATAELSFRLAELDGVNDPLSVLIPKAVRIGVDDPDLDADLVYETDRTLAAVNAAVAAIITPGTGSGTLHLAGDYDADAAELLLAHPFRPFGDPALTGSQVLLGLLLRPFRQDDTDYSTDRFPTGELDLTVLVPEVFEADATGETITGPKAETCLFPWQVEDGGEEVIWEVYVGDDPLTDFDADAAWRSLPVRGDETAGLRRSGHVYLDIPDGLSPIAFSRLSRDFWDEFGLNKPPATTQQLIDDIENGDLDPTALAPAIWKDQLGVADPMLDDPVALVAQLEGLSLDFGAVAEEDWVDAGYSAAPAPHALHWLRARLTRPRDPAPQVAAILLNTVRGTAATSRQDEVVGSSTGLPNQVFKLRRAPVLIDPTTGLPDLSLEVAEPGETRIWDRGISFFGAGSDGPRYLLDPETGEVRFGDGVQGRIPVAGAQIIARRYRVGGGAVGNVAAGTITALKSALPQVKAVANRRASSGGADAETLDETRLRTPSELRTRDRCVSAEDFADLALRTPGVALHSAFALALTRADTTTDPPSLIGDSPGAVTVIVLPRNPSQETPQPSEAQLRQICAHLNERRLITTELYVIGPRYTTITSLAAEILVARDADLKAAQDGVLAALDAYFDPLTGGEAGRGWPFGGDIYRSNVFRRILSQSGVRTVPNLRISLEGQAVDPCADVLPIAEGHLVHLPSVAVTLDVRYERDG